MKTAEIKKIIKRNPETLFNLAYKPARDYYGEKLWTHRVVTVQVHLRGYLTVIERGRHMVDPSWLEHTPYRVEARHIIKVHE